MNKLFKTLLGVVFALVIVLSTNTASAKAETNTRAYEYNGVTFYYVTDGTYSYVIGADNAVGTVEIPRIMDMYWVTEISQDAFKNNVNITGVIIPENVITIGIDAFSGCSNLKNVVLPNSLRIISAGAFANTALTKIYIPDSVEIISATAFRNTGVEGKVETSTPTPAPTSKPTSTPKPTSKPSPTPTVSGKTDVVLVTLSGMNKPEKITKGSSFGLKGTVKVEEGVDTITAYILNADNKAVIKVTDTITKGSYNINKGKVNSDLVFGKLGIGTYTYKVTVSGKNIEEQTIMSAKFEVVKAQSKPVNPTATPTPKPTEVPEPEVEVLEVNTISVSIPLNLAVNADPASRYQMMTGDVSISASRESCPISVSVFNSYSVDSSKILVSDERELPNGKTWDELNKRNAKKYFSIGLSPERGWTDVYSREASYLGMNYVTGLGEIDQGETGSIYVQNDCSPNLEEVVDFEVILGLFIKSIRDY